MSVSVAARQENAVRIRIGPHFFANRQRLEAVFGEFDQRAIQIAEDFRIRQLSSHVLPLLRSTVATAVRQYEIEERERIRAAPIDPALHESLSRAAIEAWQKSFPRVELSTFGGIESSHAPCPKTSLFGISATAPRVFFVAGEDALPESAAQIGSDLGRAVGSGESRELADVIGRVRPWQRGRDVQSRIQQALISLDKIGKPATHCLIPRDWRLRLAIVGGGRVASNTSQVLSVGTSRILDWVEWRSPAIVLMHPPGAVRFVQYDGGRDLAVDVEEVTQSRHPEELHLPNDPTIMIRARECWSIRVDRRLVRVVTVDDPALIEG